MSRRKRNILAGTGLLIIPLVYFLAFGMGILSGAGQHERTIVVTAEDMAFNKTNPDIKLVPGESIRLVFKNRGQGMRHDLVIPVLGLRTPILKTGETAVLLFRVPASGSFSYICSLHARVMRGLFVVKKSTTKN